MESQSVEAIALSDDDADVEAPASDSAFRMLEGNMTAFGWR